LRRKRSRKRDGGIQVPLETGAAAVDGSPVDLLAMNDALTALERLDPRQARVVELRFFGGLELKEIATMLDASERTIKRDWQKARAFLEVALG
jgi:RNA polymerase sigma factor (TIGR02999 family)